MPKETFAIEPTPLDEMLRNMINELHERERSGGARIDLLLHGIALVLRDTRERHAGMRRRIDLLAPPLDEQLAHVEAHKEIEMRLVTLEGGDGHVATVDAIQSRDAADLARALTRINELEGERDRGIATMGDHARVLERLLQEANEALERIGQAYWRGVELWRQTGGTDSGALPPTRTELVTWLLEQLAARTEELRVADADRIPLRMDLDRARSELAVKSAAPGAIESGLREGEPIVGYGVTDDQDVF